MHYFGRWDDPFGAEAEYLEVADDLHAGREPQSDEHGGLTIRDLCNQFILSKKLKLDSGNLSPRTFIQYDETCRIILDSLGKDRCVSDLGPKDFEAFYVKLSQKYSTTSIGGQITQIRSVFKYAIDNDLIERSIRFGSTFKAPSRTEVRKAKAKKKHETGRRVFEPAEIRQMLKAASTQLKAMILLGINGGLGNTDCANLPISALDLTKGWLDYPRPKTGAERLVPLWPETVEALRTVIAERKEPNEAEDGNLVFVTLFGQRWVRYSVVEVKKYGKKQVKPKADDGISKATANLLKELGLKKPGLSFYSLRHTFETIAGGSRDQVAVDAIMGHIDSSMAATYRHGIEEERLLAVVNHVRDWLYG